MPSEHDVTPRGTPPYVIVSAVLLSLVAAAFMYLGVAVALTLIGVNGNAEAIAASFSHVVGAVGGPLALGLYLARRRGWAPLRAARWAGLALLLVNVVLTPIAVAALAM